MADPKIEDHSAEMAHDLHRLEDHIADAEKKLQARREEADVAGDADGDAPAGSAGAVVGTGWEGEQDRGGGDDPEGAAEDARTGAPGGSQDGPEADRRGTQAPGTGSAGGAGGEDAGDDDERVDEEVANPT